MINKNTLLLVLMTTPVLGFSFTQKETIKLVIEFSLSSPASSIFYDEDIKKEKARINFTGMQSNLLIIGELNPHENNTSILTINTAKRPDIYLGKVGDKTIELDLRIKNAIILETASQTKTFKLSKGKRTSATGKQALAHFQIANIFNNQSKDKKLLKSCSLYLTSKASKSNFFESIDCNEFGELLPGTQAKSISIPTQEIDAGAYEGNVIYHFEDQTVMQPVTLSLKDTWQLPLSITFISICLGFFVKFASALEQKEDLLEDVLSLQDNVKNSNHSDKANLLAELEVLKTKINKHSGADFSLLKAKYEEIRTKFNEKPASFSAKMFVKKVSEQFKKRSTTLIFLAKVVLLLVLSLITMWTTYDSNEIFGSTFFSDYAKIIITGFIVGVGSDLLLSSLLLKIKPLN